MSYIRSYHGDLPAEHECTDADIDDLIREIHDLDEDTALLRYENPTMVEMSAILARAAAYTGAWYHTKLVFDMEATVDEAYRTLRQQILDLPVARGVYSVTSYPSITIDFGGSNPDTVVWAPSAGLHDLG